MPAGDPDPVECFICLEPCRALCVFGCGHATCYACGLRIHTISKGSCPSCRKKSKDVVIAQTLPQHQEAAEDVYVAEELAGLRATATANRELACQVESPPLERQIRKLREHLCPYPACWGSKAEQDPFLLLQGLKDHLAVEHHTRYCEVCLRARPVFLCEQAVYSAAALKLHMDGACPLDDDAFTGHPPCKFCRGATRAYDGEALLKHMQEKHYTCDLCNMGQFTFTFYENRNKLNEHFAQQHQLCDHADCATLDPMLRVFANEIDLAIHKQRVHGQKGRATFTPGSFGTEDTYHSSAPAGAGGRTVPAAASSANTVQKITFDHVHRKETVELLPERGGTYAKKRVAPRGGRGKKGGGADSSGTNNDKNNNNNNQNEVFGLVQEVKGLPPCYYTDKEFPILYPPTRAGDATAATAADDANNSSERSTAKARGSGSGSGGASSPPPPPPQDTTKKDNDSNSNKYAAFGIAETYESYKRKNGIPQNAEEQERLLGELVQRALPVTSQLVQFMQKTREFMEGKLLSSHYYDYLVSKDGFRDKPEALEEIYPLLVATAPVAGKRTGLQEIWRMRHAPESQHTEKLRREAEAKEEEAKVWHQIHAQKSKKQKQANSNNAWVNHKGKAAIVRTAWSASAANNNNNHHHNTYDSSTQSQSSSPTSVVPKNWGVAPTPPPQSSGGSTKATPVPADFPALESADAFPSLPPSGVRRSGFGAGKKHGHSKKANNAWFNQ